MNRESTPDIGAAAVPFARIDGIHAASQQFEATTIGICAARVRVYKAVTLASTGKMTGRNAWDPAGVVFKGGVR